MEQQHRKNLEKLGKYLAKLDYRHNIRYFDMRVFLKHNGDQIDPVEVKDELTNHICGTSACAVGHAPIALPREFRALMKELGSRNNYDNTNWFNIASGLFGVGYKSESTDPNGKLWEWLFDMNWGLEYQNDYTTTSWSVADRIAYAFEHDVTNFSWTERWDVAQQIKGLCVEAGYVSQRRFNTNLKNWEAHYASPVA
jgi:hypothetical protein